MGSHQDDTGACQPGMIAQGFCEIAVMGRPRQNLDRDARACEIRSLLGAGDAADEGLIRSPIQPQPHRLCWAFASERRGWMIGGEMSIDRGAGQT